MKPGVENHGNPEEFKEVYLADDQNSDILYPQNPPPGYDPQVVLPPQHYDPQNYPPQNYPPQNYPPQNYPPQNYPPQNYPPQDYTPQNYYPGQNQPYVQVYNAYPAVNQGPGYIQANVNPNLGPNQTPQPVMVSGPPIVHIVQHVPYVHQITADDEKILKFSRYARIASIVNVIIDILIMVGVAFLFFVIGFNLLGYFGAKRFHKCMSIGFMVYLVLSAFLKVIVMIVVPYPHVIGIFIVLILLNTGVFLVFFLFVRRLMKASHSQIKKLNDYHLQQQNTGFCCFYI